MADTEVDVLVQIAGEDVLAGRLWGHRQRGAESATFRYASEYLARPGAYELDPALPLFEGAHQTPAGKRMFGAMSDCAPDRWGRRLLTRDEERRAKRDGDAQRSFGEMEYLLGVRDDLRQGALRFRDPETAVFLEGETKGVPPLLELPVLLAAADRVERNEANDAELMTLLRGGSSLGGARPKAHILDQDRVAIAKFPSPANDEWDVMRWEFVALNLARRSGIAVQDSHLHLVDGKAVLIIDRFDRAGARRTGYVSAMTMIEGNDGDHGSYLDIADVIERNSPSATENLHELWRRMAFTVLISNTDDHLRNHGFLRASSSGWSLSPAFDLNPNPEPGPKHLSTAIDFDERQARVDTLMSVAEAFRLREDAAAAVLRDVVEATAQWRTVASRAGLDGFALDQMAPAFEHEQAEMAQEIVRGLPAGT